MAETDHRAVLPNIRRFDQLIKYLRDEMGWPIASDPFEDADDLFFEFTPEELGIDPKTAAKIQEIKRLRPLSPRQPWGIFFVKFEPKQLPVVALRRILSQVALKKRASANSAERAVWAKDDLLFLSNYGEGSERQISFAHFSSAPDGLDVPTLKVIGWDNLDTDLHLDEVAKKLTKELAWPNDEADLEAWRQRWRGAFTLGHLEVVTSSKELSIRLAKLARAIRERINSVLAIENEHGRLTRLMKAFKDSLVHDLNSDGFADMYAQTIAYGLLSSRIADPTKTTAEDFASHMRTNPFLREMMETFLKVGGRRATAGAGIDFDELGVSEIVALLDNTDMEAVVRDFGDRNPQQDPISHFYEAFFKEYSPVRRKLLGVFYTPRPIVSYIVRSVDELLRADFGLRDGLADTTTWGEMAERNSKLKIPKGVSRDQAFIQILDPATGTGTFLVEVIQLIYKTMAAKWKAQNQSTRQIEMLWNEYVPKHLLPRVHGYEIQMAPYAIAHLKISLKLHETGYHFGSDERVRVYLTNALEEASQLADLKAATLFEALGHEARAVNTVKRDQRFTVVIGNPPYSNFGQLNKNPYILGLLEDYKRGLTEKKVNLDDDFIKFVRLAHEEVAKAGEGIVAMITNNTYLDGSTRRGMRQQLMGVFGRIDIVDLHGNSIEREVSPDGSSDENVFEIQQGVAIGLLSRTSTPQREGKPAVGVYDLYGKSTAKYAWLDEHSFATTPFSAVTPDAAQARFQQRDERLAVEYEQFFSVSDMFLTRGSGVKTDRDDLCFDVDKSSLRARMEKAFSGRWGASFVEEYRIVDSSSYDLTRRLKTLSFDPAKIVKCLYRLFDERWLYYQPGFTSRPAWDVMQHMLSSNVGLVAKRQSRDGAYDWFFVVRGLMVDGLFSIDNKGREQLFPLYQYNVAGEQGRLFEQGRRPNLSPKFLDEFGTRLHAKNPGAKPLPNAAVTAETLFNYAYGIFHSPTYRTRYGEFLKIEFPRFPLTGNTELVTGLAAIGKKLVALHLLEAPEPDKASVPTQIGAAKPMVEAMSYSESTIWLDAAKQSGFAQVPEAVWKFRIGGHHVCEKWLKDRKGGRLSPAAVAHFQRIVSALTETIALMDEADAVIEQHGGWPAAFAARD